MEGDALKPCVSGGRVEAAPFDVAMGEPSPTPRGEHRAGLVGRGHLPLQQQPDEIVRDRNGAARASLGRRQLFGACPLAAHVEHPCAPDEFAIREIEAETLAEAQPRFGGEGEQDAVVVTAGLASY